MEIDLNKQGLYQHFLKKGLTSGAKWTSKNGFKGINGTDLCSACRYVLFFQLGAFECGVGGLGRGGS